MAEPDEAARFVDPPPHPAHAPATTAGGRAERVAARALQAGAVAIVVAVVTWKQFELDRYFVPKELVLHLAALVAGLMVLREAGRVRASRIDIVLLAFVGLGVASALFAQNGWVAVRALAVSASGIVVLWSARVLRSQGSERPLLAAIAGATVLAAITSLLQTYGVSTDLFSINRAPGGTLGNRNFVAHAAAFGLPVTLLVALRARRGAMYVLASVGAAVNTAVLVLTRSRAGLLALAAVLLVLAVALVSAPALRRHGRTWARVLGALGLAASGIAGAVLVPNTLNWRSANPYVESLTGVANYQEGSGRGRLVQYRRSLAMAAEHPVLGVGPGNWAVAYPEHAAPRDPSLDGREQGTTSNPWPSSDWIAFVAERGFLAALLFGAALLGMALLALRTLYRTDSADEALGAAALVATLAATLTAGMFDAVLLLALPTLLVFAAAGALWPTELTAAATPPGGHRTAARMGMVALLFLSAIGLLRSTAQITAMGIDANSSRTTWLSRAARIDPGNYRLRIRLARVSSGLRRDARCEHARAARELYPSAREARLLSRGCD